MPRMVKQDIRTWSFEDFEGQPMFQVTAPEFRVAINQRLGGEIVKPNTIRNAIQLGNLTKGGERVVLPTLRIGRENWCSVECFLAYSAFLARADAEVVANRAPNEGDE